MQRRLGRRWVKLHRTVYLIGILGVAHFFWQVKVTTFEPLIYTFILVVLLGFRVRDWIARRRRTLAISKP
jgi:sulfoxide reductase heme-binding subunit YedZ